MAESDGMAAADLDRLQAWATGRLPGQGLLSARRLTQGLSNEMFLIARDGWRGVLRRPPAVSHQAVSARSVGREHRVLQALAGTGVRVPRPVGHCDDLEVIGAPFLVMEYVEGVRLYDGLPPGYDNAQERGRLGSALTAGLVALHQVDWMAAGLESFGRPIGFTERQLRRWTGQLQELTRRDFPELDSVIPWLEANVPEMQRSSIIHGDYGFHNVLFPPVPGPVSAIVDWETSTIGDPLMDVGYFLSMWLEEHEREQWFACALPYDVSGFESRAELIESYADGTGLDVKDLGWYMAVAQIKMAAMLEGTYVRYLEGARSDARAARLERVVPNHIARAVALVDSVL